MCVAGERKGRKNGKEKRVGKKEEIRVPGILDTTKMHRSISAPSFNGSPTCEIPVGLSGPI